MWYPDSNKNEGGRETEADILQLSGHPTTSIENHPIIYSQKPSLTYITGKRSSLYTKIVRFDFVSCSWSCSCSRVGPSVYVSFVEKPSPVMVAPVLKFVNYSRVRQKNSSFLLTLWVVILFSVCPLPCRHPTFWYDGNIYVSSSYTYLYPFVREIQQFVIFFFSLSVSRRYFIMGVKSKIILVVFWTDLWTFKLLTNRNQPL